MMIDDKTKKAISEIHEALLLGLRYVAMQATMTWISEHEGLINSETMMKGLYAWDHVNEKIETITADIDRSNDGG